MHSGAGMGKKINLEMFWFSQQVLQNNASRVILRGFMKVDAYKEN